MGKTQESSLKTRTLPLISRQLGLYIRNTCGFMYKPVFNVEIRRQNQQRKYQSKFGIFLKESVIQISLVFVLLVLEVMNCQGTFTNNTALWGETTGK